MFTLLPIFKLLDKELKATNDELIKLKKWKASLVRCERCSCLIEKKYAEKGEPKVVAPDCSLYGQWPFELRVEENYKVHIPWYCKVHAPKKQKDKS